MASSYQDPKDSDIYGIDNVQPEIQHTPGQQDEANGSTPPPPLPPSAPPEPNESTPPPPMPPSMPQDQDDQEVEHWYPQLGKDKTLPPGTAGDMNYDNQNQAIPGANNDANDVDNVGDVDNIGDDEKKEEEDIEEYEMCEGIASLGTVNCIELQAEGNMISASMCTSKCAPSFIPQHDNNKDGQELDADAVVKKLNGSLGLFKSKQKRINAFTEMILSTNKEQRQAIKKQYELKYKVSLQRTIERLAFDMISSYTRFTVIFLFFVF